MTNIIIFMAAISGKKKQPERREPEINMIYLSCTGKKEMRKKRIFSSIRSGTQE